MNDERRETKEVITRYEWVLDREGFLVKREMEVSSMQADPKGHLR